MKTNLKMFLAVIPPLAAALLFCGCAGHKSGSCCASGPQPTPATKAAAPAANNAAVVPALPSAAKVALKFVRVDSEETDGEDGKGANAVDGDPSTMWHTQWQDANPECPHEIVIELVPPAVIKGFTYLPRQDEGENGTIKDYEFYVSADGKDFGQPVAKGTFENNKDKKTVACDAKTCRFVKLKALSEINGAAWTSAAEIGVVPQ